MDYRERPSSSAPRAPRPGAAAALPTWHAPGACPPLSDRDPRSAEVAARTGHRTGKRAHLLWISLTTSTSLEADSRESRLLDVAIPHSRGGYFYKRTKPRPLAEATSTSASWPRRRLWACHPARAQAARRARRQPPRSRRGTRASPRPRARSEAPSAGARPRHPTFSLTSDSPQSQESPKPAFLFRVGRPDSRRHLVERAHSD